MSQKLCGGDCKDTTTVYLWVLKGNKRDGVRGLSSLSSIFSPMKRQDTEWKGSIMSPQNALSWLPGAKGDIS